MLAYFREVRPPAAIANERLLASLLARVMNATRGKNSRPVGIHDVIEWSDINRIKAKGDERELTVEEWQTMMRHTYGG